MKLKPNAALLFLLLFCAKTFSQTSDSKQQIIQHLENYFALDRENIHLHLNKDIFLSEENIWFKGYAYNRRELLPFYSTSNVFVALYNQSGTLINQQLVYANMGAFEGVFKDLKMLPSGNYYIQTFTNWMNNFTEDESSVYPIKIINAKQPNFFDTSIINISSAIIEIHPEGGTLLNGVTNTVGIKLIDKFNNPIGNLIVELRDSKEQVISEIALNSNGMAKFIYIPNSNTFSLNAKVNDKTIKQNLPAPVVVGISIEVNNYALNNKALVKIKTNATTFANLKSKKLFLVVHQDQRASIFDINLDPNTFDQDLVFSTENMAEGVNFVRIIDENMNELGNRAILKTAVASEKFNLEKNVNNQGIMQLQGTSTASNAHLSVSIVPINSIATENSASLTATFLGNSYLNEPIKNLEYYNTNPSIAKRFELDLILLNQSKPKYNWNTIIDKAPTPEHEFDMGLTVKGKILSNPVKNPEAYNVRLRSFFHQLLVQSPISDVGDFEFKNLLLYDSTTVDLGLFKNIESDPLKFKCAAKIVNGKRDFKFSFKGYNLSDVDQSPNTIIEDIPGFFEGTVQLDAVKIQGNKNELKRGSSIENRNLRGYKVPETASTNVLYYIGINGFNVVDSASKASITGRVRTSISGGATIPVVYIDNIQIFDFMILQTMLLDELDEIYMNPNAIVSSVRNNQGIIRMYRKIPKMSISKTNLQSLVLLEGYANPTNFKNADYSSASSEGFVKYGVINWTPTLLTDEKNTFLIEVPNYNQKTVKVIIEGFTYDGKLISETQIIDL
jgi:hypothetical protein